MEIYAAMVENLDHNIGRLIGYLKRTGQYDNTFIFFQSDNGAEGGTRVFPTPRPTTTATRTSAVATRTSRYGKRWAEVSATPFRPWKGYTTEGGVIVPAIARLPKQRLLRAVRWHHARHRSGADVPRARRRRRSRARVQGARRASDHGQVALAAAREPRVHGASVGATCFVDELFGRRYVRRDQLEAAWSDKPVRQRRLVALRPRRATRGEHAIWRRAIRRS